MSTIALTIDYSNGAQKHFGNIPWTKDLTILGALQASERIPPGATVSFGSDRSGRTLGLLIDGLPAGTEGALEWSVWINEKSFEGGGDHLGTHSSFGFHPEEREANLLQPGDQIVMKLTLATKKPG